MVSTIAGYQLISRNLVRSLEETARKPAVSHATAYYLSQIGDVTSVDEFLMDDQLFSYAMKAHGLSDVIYAKAFLHKVLTEGISNPSSFANNLVDTRYREFAAVFNFGMLGDNATRTAAATTGTVAKYLRQTLEDDAGEENEGVGLALYFERKAPKITSADQILADKALLKVVQTTLGISPLTAISDIDAQAALLTNKVDFAEFQNPERLRTFLQRFAVMWETENDEAGPAMTPSILIHQPLETGIDVSVLAGLQALKFGS